MEKKKIIAFGSIMIGFALSASVLSTVAWYNGSSNLQVSNFNIELANKELKISADNIDFKEVLNKDELNQVEKFIPVSSMFSSSWINEKATMPSFRKGFAGKEPEQAYYSSIDEFGVADTGYFSQMLYLKSDSTAYVSLDPEKTRVMPDTTANEQIAYRLESRYPGMSHEEIVNNLNHVQDSLRISILVLGDEDDEALSDYAYYIFDPHKDGDTYLGSILDNDLDGYFDSFENKEVLYGEASNISDETLVYVDEGIHSEGTSYSVFNASTKQGVKHLDLEASMAAGLELAKENSLGLDDWGDMKLSLRSDVSKRIVLSFYLEGWDRDNTNLAMYSHFYVNLAFKLADGGKGGI